MTELHPTISFLGSNPDSEPEGLTKRDFEVLAAFRKIRVFLYFSEEQARQQGLAPQQDQLLLTIQGRPGRCWTDLEEISDFLHLKNHSVVDLVNRADAMGLERRQPCDNDHRVTEFYLTAYGHQVLDSLTRAHRRELLALSREIHSLLDAMDSREDLTE